jgi:hypothetical protein
MTERLHLLHGDWNDRVHSTHARMSEHAVEGAYSIRVLVVESVWDSFCYNFVLRDQQLLFTGTRWYRASDYNKWQQKIAFTPDLLTLSKALSAEEADYFPDFFHSLVSGSTDQMLEEIPGWVLDGADTEVRLFRNSELVCKFEWGAQLRTCGPLKQLEQLMDRSRTYFPNK